MALENILPGIRRRRYPNAPPAPPGKRNRVRHPPWLNQNKGRLRMTEPAFRNARISRLGLLLLPVHLQVDSRCHLLQLFEAGFGLLSVGSVGIEFDGFLISFDRSGSKLRHFLIADLL